MSRKTVPHVDASDVKNGITRESGFKGSADCLHQFDGPFSIGGS